MPGSPQNVYWDANNFLSYINEHPERVALLESLLSLSSHRDAQIKIYTSTLSHVEVAFSASEQNNQALDPEQERRIDDLWNDPSAVVSVEVHQDIIDRARSLIRESITRGWSLKPADAIHIATAQWLSRSGVAIAEFHTYDDRLCKFSEIVEFEIVEPYTDQPPSVQRSARPGSQLRRFIR